jgi:hypothetical protein
MFYNATLKLPFTKIGRHLWATNIHILEILRRPWVSFFLGVTTALKIKQMICTLSADIDRAGSLDCHLESENSSRIYQLLLTYSAEVAIRWVQDSVHKGLRAIGNCSPGEYRPLSALRSSIAFSNYA